MGLIADAFRVLIPEAKVAIAATVPTWDNGVPQTQQASYYRSAREGYMADELVYQCIEVRATAAGEPPVCAYRKGGNEYEKVDDHPSLDLLNHPNPFMGRADFWGTVVMSLDIGGNGYVEKVPSGAGKTVELWPLRADRVRVIPDRQRFIGGYTYTVGDQVFTLPPERVIRFKTRHPLDDYYGLSPLWVLAGRVDLDIWTRKFAESFFRNAGVPTGLINIQRIVSETEREAIRRRFREVYGGVEGWHKPIVFDGGTATYTPMGMGMGSNGLAMEMLTNVNEARICGVYGVPPSLIPTLLGAGSSSYANRVSDRELFWEETMVPLFRELDTALTSGLIDEYPDLDHFEHDLSKIKALQEDEDKKHARYRDDWKAGMITWAEARAAIGMPEEPDEPGHVLIPTTMVPTWSDDLLEQQEVPEPVAAPAMQPGQNPQNPNALPAAPAPPQPAQNGAARNGAA